MMEKCSNSSRRVKSAAERTDAEREERSSTCHVRLGDELRETIFDRREGRTPGEKTRGYVSQASAGSRQRKKTRIGLQSKDQKTACRKKFVQEGKRY